MFYQWFPESQRTVLGRNSYFLQTFQSAKLFKKPLKPALYYSTSYQMTFSFKICLSCWKYFQSIAWHTLPCSSIAEGSNCINWKFLPSIAFDNDPPPDYENCKEHVLTHLIFTPSLHDSQPSIHKHKTWNRRIFYKTSTLRIGKSLSSILGLSDKITCTPFLLSYSSKLSKN